MNERDALITLWAAELAALDWNNRPVAAFWRGIHQYANRERVNYILLHHAIRLEAMRLYRIMLEKQERRHD